MATRSTIAVEHADGTVSQVYCHWDGYLDHNGRMLVTHYNSLERAEALVALGSISSLAASIDCPNGHNFVQPVEGYTVFYGRDRGEDETEPNKFSNFEMYKYELEEQEYNYIFRNGEWKEGTARQCSVAEALANNEDEDHV